MLYPSFQNGHHSSILLFTCKLTPVACSSRLRTRQKEQKGEKYSVHASRVDFVSHLGILNCACGFRPTCALPCVCICVVSVNQAYEDNCIWKNYSNSVGSGKWGVK